MVWNIKVKENTKLTGLHKSMDGSYKLQLLLLELAHFYMYFFQVCDFSSYVDKYALMQILI